jgi:hypothetical protein
MFQNPALLWGMLAVAVPIALHFWHQQRAKPLPWAMLRWLQTPNQPPKRGFRFDELWLLLLRCGLLVVLSLLLARPTLPPDANVPTKAVHLVEPNRTVTDGFRFELEQARQRGEAIYWATDVPTRATDLGTLPPDARTNPLTVQAAVNQLQTSQARLHIYAQNTLAWTDAPLVVMPSDFVLHALPAATNTPTTTAILSLPIGKAIGVDEQGRWVLQPAPKPGQKAVGTLPLRVLVQFRNPDERRAVRAALGALQETYQLPFIIDENSPANPPNWVITDRPVEQPTPGTFYTTTAPPTRPDQPNVTYLTGPFTPTNDLLTPGQLPERLGTLLAARLGLQATPAPLSASAFTALFVPAPPAPLAAEATGSATAHPRNTLQTALLVLFLSLLLLERWVATRR